MNIKSRKQAKLDGDKRYFTGKSCVNGHVTERSVSSGGCLECHRLVQRKRRVENPESSIEISRRSYYKNVEHSRERARDWYRKNSEVVKERKRKANKTEKYIKTNRDYVKNNKERINKNSAEWRSNNPQKVIDTRKRYYEKNKEKIRESYIKWYKKNPTNRSVRSAIERIEKYKGSKIQSKVGYTHEELIMRIEFQFKDGMSWDNRSEWHIDHKKPISRFLKQGVYDIRIINALSNLRPVWAKDNLSKGSKWK